MSIQVLLFATVMATSLLVHGSTDTMEDPDMAYIYTTQKLFMKFHAVYPPYHYSWGFELYNATTGFAIGLYESRYRDLAIGTFYKVSPNDDRKIVEYTLDTTHGFQATVRRDVKKPVPRLGFARLAAPAAFTFRPASADLPMTLVENLEKAGEASSLARDALRTHIIIMKYYELQAPFNVSWGYEIWNAKKVDSRSNYESYVGDEGEGRFVYLGEDGVDTGIVTKVDASGFYVSIPDTPATAKPADVPAVTPSILEKFPHPELIAQ